MKVIAITALCLLSLAASAQWDDVKTVQQGRERTRTQFVGYDSRDKAETYNPVSSAFYIPLNGGWSFAEAKEPSQANISFAEERKISVPSYWTAASADELSAIRPPALPADNPVGQYRRDVDIPGVWLDREIFLCVGGVRSAFTLYVNGRKVGYSTDSATPAEFNISRYIAAQGRNTINMEVYKWSQGSWLEGSSTAGAGIAGEVYLYSQPRVSISDFVIDAAFDPSDKTGKLTLDIIAANSYNTDAEVAVHFDIEDSKGNIVKFNDRTAMIPAAGVDTLRFTLDVAGAAQWSSETPNTYQLIMRLRQDGRFTEYIPYKFGFRDRGQLPELKDTLIVHKGIDPDPKTMRAELEAIKKAGYNAIQCLYHPDKNRLYETCLQVGLYVIDRPNIDPMLLGRGIQSGGSVSNDPQWAGAYIFRGENAWFSGRNHSAVVELSLGGMESAGMYNVYRLENRMGEIMIND